MSADPNSILHDPGRLLALNQTALLDSPPEESFDRLARLAARLLNVPIALVSLVDGERQFFKSRVGIPEQMCQVLSPLTHSFCQHVVVSAKPFIVEDARKDSVLKDNLAVGYGVVAYAGIPLNTAEGLTLGSFCVIDDKVREWTVEEIETLTELAGCVMTEINLRRAKDSAEAASAAKDRFLAFLSHELRGPLTPALLIAASLEDDKSATRHVRDEAGIIRRNIQLATHLADDLLDVTRLATGKFEPQLKATDLHEVVKVGIAQCTSNALTKNLKIEIELRAAQHTVRGDGPRLIQVIRNILSNAVKFTPAGGTICVRTTDINEKAIRIEIVDSGCGVDADFMAKMFDPYEQGNRDVTREHLGLGLGLTICRGIIDAHNGTISAHSEGKDRGTTFVIDLPSIPAADRAPCKNEIASHKGEPAGRVRIMLVEDHDDTRRVMKRLLTNLNYSIVTAGSIEEALQTFSDHTPDLVISDIGLPDGTGLDLIRQLLARRPIQAIALTGYGTETDTEQTRAAGFTAHLTKPIDFKELVNMIGQLTRRLPAESTTL